MHIIWTQIYNFLAVQVIYTNYASDVMLIFYILGLSSIFIFFDRRTLKFLKMLCNPTNKKIVALSNKNNHRVSFGFPTVWL